MTELITTPEAGAAPDPWTETEDARRTRLAAEKAAKPKHKAAPHTSWPQAEALFGDWRIQYELIDEFPLADVHDVAGQQVRDADNRAKPDAVAEYVEHYKAGAEFPPLILTADGAVIDGNTRRAMADRCGLTHFPVYKVRVPSMAYAQAIGAAFNQMNGHRLSEEEALREAARMLDDENLGFTDQQIASAVGRPIHQIRKWRTNNEVERRAADRGKDDELARIPKIQRSQLAKVRQAAPFDAVIDLASSRRMKNADLKALVTEVAEAESEQDALEVIRDASNALLGGGPKGIAVVANKKAQRMRMILPQIAAFPPFDDIYEPEKAETDRKLWQQVAEIASGMLAGYERHGIGVGQP